MSHKAKNLAIQSSPESGTLSDRVVYVPSLRYIREGNTYIPSVDISSAKAYGQIQYMTTPGNGFASDAAVTEVENHADDSHASDLLMMVGDMILFAAAFRVIANRWGHVNVLRWDNRRMSYIEQCVKVGSHG